MHNTDKLVVNVDCSIPWEDYHLGQRTAEVANDEILKAAEAREAYRSYLAEETS
jgi:hypothetical protein